MVSIIDQSSLAIPLEYTGKNTCKIAHLDLKAHSSRSGSETVTAEGGEVALLGPTITTCPPPTVLVIVNFKASVDKAYVVLNGVCAPRETLWKMPT